MKVTTTKTEFQSSGLLQNYDVGISDRPEDQLMILNIISDTLYTDKIQALWREYGANAVDANVEAGRGHIPIEITLPTLLSPTAVIRDFGFGMSEDQVANTYVKVGASTKRETNEQTGYLGIGSKAGYAYGTTFTVTSFLKGTKTVYNCYKDGDGRLHMASLSKTETEELDGVEIGIPVKKDDIEDFIKRAATVFRYFKVKPIVKGGELSLERFKTILEGTNWKLVTSNTYSKAIMGNIAYGLSDSGLPADFPENKKALLRMGVELEFPLGALEIAANRESVQYKDKTLHALNKALDIVLAEIKTQFTAKIEAAKTYWEAVTLYGNLLESTYNASTNYNSGSYELRDLLVKSKVTWKGIPVTDRFDISTRSTEMQQYKDGVKIVTYTLSYQGRMHRSYAWELNPSKKQKLLLVLSDIEGKNRGLNRIRHWLRSQPTASNKAYRLYREDQVVLFKFANAETQQTYLEDLHLSDAPFVMLSSLPKPSRPKKGPSKYGDKHRATLLELNENTTTLGSFHAPASMWWTPTEIDKDNGKGIYIIIDRFKADFYYQKVEYLSSLYPGKEAVGVSPTQILQDLKTLRAVGIKIPKVYGVKVSQKGSLGKGWVELTAYAQKVFKQQFKKNPKLAQDIIDYIVKQHFSPIMVARALENLELTSFPENSIIKQYMEALKARLSYSPTPESGKYYGLFSTYQELRNLLPKPTTDYTQLNQDILKRYPLLKAIDSYKASENFGALLGYFKLVENQVRK